MEKILDTFLDRVRLDAVAKLKNADTTAKDPQNKVIAAAKEIMKLADIARKNGLLILESMAETTDSDLLRQLILLVVDGTNPDMVVEIGTNFYWTEAPDGADAMAEYMYLRGMLSIQNGDNPRTLDLILASLMPAGHRWRSFTRARRWTNCFTFILLFRIQKFGNPSAISRKHSAACPTVAYRECCVRLITWIWLSAYTSSSRTPVKRSWQISAPHCQMPSWKMWRCARRSAKRRWLQE